VLLLLLLSVVVRRGALLPLLLLGRGQRGNAEGGAAGARHIRLTKK
jgi:hypothetical protein